MSELEGAHWPDASRGRAAGWVATAGLEEDFGRLCLAAVGDTGVIRFLEEVAQALAASLAPDRLTIALLDEDGERLRLEVAVGAEALCECLPEGASIPVAGSPLEPVVRGLRPRVVEDLARGGTRRHAAERALRRAGLRSYVALPLIAGGRAIGVLNLGSRRPGAFRAPVSSWLSEVVSSLVSLGIEARRRGRGGSAVRRRAASENAAAAGRRLVEAPVLIGSGPGIRETRELIELAAGADASVLVTGETGTGKELVARAVHAASARARGPFVAVNCAALPEGLVESEFFGYERGAFTGAAGTHPGHFERAEGGTLLLDELGDLPLPAQAKLLRAIEEGEIERLGATAPRAVDVRVLATTNADLAGAVAAGRFRPDLFYRLNVLPIRVPALRERAADIPALAAHFVASLSARYERPEPEIGRDVMSRLCAYDWPGNVRELRNVIERAVLRSHSGRLELPARWPEETPGSGNSELALAHIERAHIETVLERCGWRIAGAGGAADRLGLPRSTLQHRMVKLGISRPR